MQELTLTGATLTSDAPLIEMKETNAALGGKQHHAHSHSHGHGRACCGSPTPMLIAGPPSVPLEQVLAWEPAKTFQHLADIIKRGTYDSFEQLILNLKDKAVLFEVLDQVGEDGPSLVHWSARRVDDIRFLTLLCEHVSPETINIASKDDVAMRALHWACTEGSIPHVAVLLRNGANIEATDKSGCTPLLISAQYGHVEVVAFLLQKGANGKAVDDSWDTAFHWAAYKGSIQVCGLLLFREELAWTATDRYGQTPLHLASLRGHTTVVRYLLQEGTRQECKQLLFLKDKNGNTPLDLAINRKRPNVQAVLRQAMEEIEQQRHVLPQVRSALRQLCSLHSWQVWFGIHAMNDQVDDAPKFPFYFMLLHVAVATLWYPFVFLPLGSTSKGVLWDLMGWNTFCLIILAALWFSIYKTYTTNPGTLDECHPKTAELRRVYEQTLESYSDEENFANQKTPLCHTCHISKPLRSKHCRIARRCVLMFDHHCPFVGNTIGLDNYKWFYLILFFMALAVTCFLITLGIHLSRQPKMQWGLLWGGLYIGLFLFPSAGMCIYHTQLMLLNLTTNEHQNMRRYHYLNEGGRYNNPFSRGYWNNIMDRFSPSEASYTLPEAAMERFSLVQNPGGNGTHEIV